MIDLLPNSSSKKLFPLQVVQICRQSTADVLDAFADRRHVDRGDFLAESMRKVPSREFYKTDRNVDRVPPEPRWSPCAVSSFSKTCALDTALALFNSLSLSFAAKSDSLGCRNWSDVMHFSSDRTKE